ncbi:uncharacterized protein MONBRDRAFT_34528 [Monosiga brevicollis MX1]|uniref:Uncharacterized protein n=1 Tax=Monosiga brevicollis TaxID=81824 RepID=A9VCA6_MONBE|nr:uncharacterized protein MONBRDRAFT_34528 [Monosiga brevicollis MX1]EDQ84866.1 predicted protein [Monosiga brevicollis MX1]|eukprot:XP_001750367.1 hypothetical protein [Monosiga brevicollis MX1]
MLRKGVLAMLPGPTMRLPSLTRLGSQPPLALVTQRRHVKVDLTRLSESNLERKTRGAITPRRAHIHFQQVFTKLFMAGELPEAWLEHLPPDLSRSSIHIKFLRQASMATWRTLPDEEKEKYIQAYEARKHNVEAYVPQKPGPPPLLTRHMDYWWYEQGKKEAAQKFKLCVPPLDSHRNEWRRKFALYFVEARKAVMGEEKTPFASQTQSTKYASASTEKLV